LEKEGWQPLRLTGWFVLFLNSDNSDNSADCLQIRNPQLPPYEEGVAAASADARGSCIERKARIAAKAPLFTHRIRQLAAHFVKFIQQ
jgi:hypothetical protein